MIEKWMVYSAVQNILDMFTLLWLKRLSLLGQSHLGAGRMELKKIGYNLGISYSSCTMEGGDCYGWLYYLVITVKWMGKCEDWNT